MTPFEIMEKAVRDAAAAAQDAESNVQQARELAKAAELNLQKAADAVLAALQAEQRAKDVLAEMQAAVQRTQKTLDQANAELHEVEEARRKVLDGVAAGSRFQFVIAKASDLQNNTKPPKFEIQLPPRLRRLLAENVPTPPVKKPLVPVVLDAPTISVVKEPEAMLIKPRVLPPKKVKKPQGSQPGRKVPHQPKSIMFELPWEDQCRAIVYHLLGYIYRLPLIGLNQGYVQNRDPWMLISRKTKGVNAGVPIIKGDLFSEMVNIDWSCIIMAFAAFDKAPWSMRLVTPHKAHYWKLTPFGLHIFENGTPEDIDHLASEYHRMWPSPFKLRKESKARAIFFGTEKETDMQAIIDLHREFGIDPIVHNEPAPRPPRPRLNDEVDGQEPEQGVGGA